MRSSTFYWVLFPGLCLGAALVVIYLGISVKAQLVSDTAQNSVTEFEEMASGLAESSLPIGEVSSGDGADDYGDEFDAHTEAEFRLENLKRLMATPVRQVSNLEKLMIVEQILGELPYLVSEGELHPFDATLAHVKAVAHQDIELQEAEVEAIKDEYLALYPLSVRLASHPEH